MSQLITTQSALDTFCEAIFLEKPEFITVDTEFMRERTYYPLLCLIQVASPENVAAIDPLAKLDLSPFFKLLQDPNIMKVFHAAYQDVEIFYYLTNQVPSPLYDTQIAAMACGYGESVSYEALVNSLAKTSIDKGSRFTDWSHRPLSDRQIAYALGDVTHLRTVYLKLKTKLKETGREHWIADEIATLASIKTYDLDPYDSWKKIRYRNMRPKGLAYLREITAFRELEAQRLDIPRPRVLKDETLLEIAASMPKSKEQLQRIRGITENQAGGPLGRSILQAVERVDNLSESDYPEPHKGRPSSSKSDTALIDMLKLLQKIICEENQVAAKLIASSKDIEMLASQEQPDLPVLKDWRNEVFGKKALDLKSGRIGFAYKNGKIKFIPL